MNWTYQRSPNTFLPNVNGQYRFSSLNSFLTTNTPNRVVIANGNPSLDFREYDTFLYAGDDWKIRQNLTLNLGLTWTYYGQPANLFHDLTSKPFRHLHAQGLYPAAGPISSPLVGQ